MTGSTSKSPKLTSLIPTLVRRQSTDGEELPALDGSSEPFLKLIEQVGIKRQAGPRKYIRVVKTIERFDG